MKVMSVRLDEGTYEDLEERSSRLGIPPAVLARAFIVGALDGGADLMISPTLPELQRASSTETSSEKPSKPTVRTTPTKRKKRKGR